MSKIPMLEKFAAQSLVEHDGELIFSKEKFAELIIQECATLTLDHRSDDYYQGWLDYRDEIQRHFGVEQ